MKFREHRGGLAEAMETVVEVEGMRGLVAHMQKLAEQWPSMPVINVNTVKVKPYGFDSRINWDTHLVTVEGYGVFGFTDGPAQSEKTSQP